MARKKTMRKTKRNRKNKPRSRRYKRGGGFFDFFTGNSSVVSDDCDPMKLTQLKSSEEMRSKYQQCCPKKYFGMVKNTSPYCKQLDLNFKSAVESEGLQKQYVGMEDPVEVAQMQNAPMLPAAPALPVQTEYPQMNQAVGGRMKRRTRRNNRKYLRK
jgi:hypothetical protein